MSKTKVVGERIECAACEEVAMWCQCDPSPFQPDPRDAEIARLRERLTKAEAVCHAVWNHEQADDAFMSGARIGATVQAWHDATQAD